MALTPQEIQSARESNNIPNNYIAVPTAVGGVVFVLNTRTDLIQQYQSGELTGGEAVPGGVALRVMPTPPAPPTRKIPQIQVNTPVVAPQIPVTKPHQVIQKVDVPIFVEITAKPIPFKTGAVLEIEVLPAATPQQTKTINYNINFNLVPIQINISEPLIFTANQFLSDIINVYVDEERELKTLLNYGEDKQSVVLAYRKGPLDVNGIENIQLKLLQPVPEEISVNTPVFLSREVAKTTIDKVRVRFTPELDKTPYLRPKNLKVKTDLDTGKFVKNVNLNKLLLNSGSVGLVDQNQNKDFTDTLFREWYSYDFNSAELNLDFTNYENFVFYSSANLRLAAFKQKLKEIERLEVLRQQFQTTYAPESSAAVVFLREKSAEYSLQKENIIRSFDRYEQHLYFTSGTLSPYTASFDYVDGGVEFNSSSYWPKSGSVLWPVDSTVAVEWYTSQSAIAQRFDEFNENNLVNTIPSYLREDDSSAAYLTFVTMIGQLFDNIKLYVDQFPNIYDRTLNPNTGLSKDLVSEIAEASGFIMPTIDSLYNLSEAILGTGTTTARRDLAIEVYKRLLHNFAFFAKAKGTKTALESLLKTFSITSQLITVKETGTPTVNSYRVFDEYTNGLYYTGSQAQYIKVPLSASLRNPILLQLNCSFDEVKPMTVVTADEKWALRVSPHATNTKLGRFEIYSGSTPTLLVTSSYHPIFGDELVNVAIQTYNNTSSFHFIKVDGEDVIFNQIIKNTQQFPTCWTSSQYVYIGGSGSLSSGQMSGKLDEIRVWGTQLSDEVILNSAFDPNSSAGDTYSDAANYLYAQLSFNDTASISTNTILNESPYKNKTSAPSLASFDTYNITVSDVVRYNRVIKQYTPVAGSGTYLTNKIVVADEPKFINDVNGLRLYRNKSIVAPEKKKFNKGRNKVIVAVTPTDVVNQNIIRTLGLENINAVLGAPTTIYKTFEKSLDTLKRHYQKYHYVDVYPNRFIRVLSNISSAINQIADYFIPTRATLIKGILIEPNILEQVKIPPVKNMRVYGKETRKTIDAANSLTGSAPDYGATFNVSKDVNAQSELRASNTSHTQQTKPVQQAPEILSDCVIDNKGLISYQPPTTASYTRYTTTVDNHAINVVDGNYSVYASSSIKEYYDIAQLSASYNVYSHDGLDMGLVNLNKIPFNSQNNGAPGAEPYNRIYSRKLFTEEITATRVGGNTSIYTPGLYDIPPSADFRDFGVYTYFNNKEGIYYFNQIKKIPVYNSPLNATWNFENQSFGNTAVSWSFQGTYNKYDVVYQDVTDDTFGITNLTGADAETDQFLTLKDIVKKSNGGNKRYYVFKNKPVYATPEGEGTFYSGSVPSYLPPSLDKRNWDLLRFKPIQVRVPKRVVFDTFRVSRPELNNFKVTTISPEINLNVSDRYIDRYDIGTVAENSFIVGELILQNIALLFATQTNYSSLRLRLYRTKEARDNDLSRDINVLPTDSHGVLLDTTLTKNSEAEVVNIIPTLVSGDEPTTGKIYYTINNLEAVAKKDLTLLLYYFAIQLEPRYPRGYLRKHYRFFRDNSTATKRRNYLGCKNTIDTTIDGLPPVQVFISEGTEIQVTKTTGNQEIITGGGGTLNVT